ncbi:hypothetical protein QR685DRAFT_516670 [Neurospora intermedia]|uniref:Uncharacterized protein n=1 Tax=Neurospora intermedia TaxID=5142 RepID=A0ABR3DL34_NEUIN
MMLSSIAPSPPLTSLFCPVDMRPHLSSPSHPLLPVECLVTPMHVYAGCTGRKEDARNHSNSILSFHFIISLPSTGNSCDTKTHTHTHNETNETVVFSGPIPSSFLGGRVSSSSFRPTTYIDTSLYICNMQAISLLHYNNTTLDSKLHKVFDSPHAYWLTFATIPC